MNIEKNVKSFLEKVNRVCNESKRDPSEVVVLGASKSQELASIKSAYLAGIQHFGENFLQEAEVKIRSIDPPPCWHFIGSIQSRKAKKISSLFHWVHTLDRFKVAKLLNDHRPNYLGKLNVCVQVNPDNEVSKSGIRLEESEEFILSLKDLYMLNVRGLMAIPKYTEDSQQQREVFAKIQIKFRELKKNFPHFDTLSMGMSEDYRSAIQEGATMIRIGTNIFGKRNEK